MNEKYVIAMGAWGAAFIAYMGGWSGHIWTLAILMCIDFAVGMALPIFMGKSKKSRRGKIESYACRRGIIKKCVVLLMVYVSWLLGDAASVHFLADAVCIAFIVAEVISIVEHAAIIGVPIPKVLIRAINVLNEKTSGGVDALASGALRKEEPQESKKENNGPCDGSNSNNKN